MYKIEVNPSIKIDSTLTVFDIDREIILYHEVPETASRTVGFGMVVEKSTRHLVVIDPAIIEVLKNISKRPQIQSGYTL